MSTTTILVLAVVLVSVVAGESIDGYLLNKSNGIGYKLMYQARPWKTALETCEREGGMLAVPKSEEEFTFVQKVVRGMSFKNVTDGNDYKLLVWVGVSSLDRYNEWTTVDGENIKKTGFSRWARGNGESISADPREPHCAGVDGFNDGYRDFWCHRFQPYVCQKNL